MKNITKLSLWLAVSSLPLGLFASTARAAEGHECTWNGTVTAVNPQDKIVTAKGWFQTKTFNIGARCGITAVDKPQAALTDLRPGDKVRIRYQKSGGVLVADRIDERALKVTGTLQSVDPKTGVVGLEAPPLHSLRLDQRMFTAAGDCKVVLWNGRSGTLGDMRLGDHVTVVYQMPGGSPTAYHITDDSQSFTGKLQAADLSEHIVRVGEKYGQKTFSLGDGCRISVRGQDNASMSELILGQNYTFTFHEVNGVNVADRVSYAPEGKATAPQGLNPAPGTYGANY